MASSLATGALLVGIGAVVGGAVGAFVVATANAPAGGVGDGAATGTTETRVVDVEQRLGALERKVGGRARVRSGDGDDAHGSAGGAARSATGDAPHATDAAGVPIWATDGGDGNAGVTVDFVRAVRAAIGTIQRENAEASAAQGREKAREQALNEVDKRLRDYSEKLGLSEQQVTAFRAAAEGAFDRRKDAEANGATREELAALDRDKERAYREVLGSATHREFRKLEIDRVARPVIVDVANRAGVDQDQRNRIERLLADHIDRYVGPETRLRTEELDAQTRDSIVRDLTEANRTAWDRLRNEILTPEQRDRVPVRLR